MKKGLLLLLLLMCILLLPRVGGLIIPDSELSDGARQWIDDKGDLVPDHKNLFHALTGFGVAADEDPVQEGARLVREANNTIHAFTESEVYKSDPTAFPEFDADWSKPRLEPKFDSGELCDIKIEPLTKEEKDMGRVLRNEFMFTFSVSVYWIINRSKSAGIWEFRPGASPWYSSPGISSI